MAQIANTNAQCNDLSELEDELPTSAQPLIHPVPSGFCLR